MDALKRFLRRLFGIKVNYYAYIKSAEWRRLARRVKERAGMRCKKCRVRGTFRTLHVHHKTYDRLGFERFSDLECLCADCHRKVSKRNY